MALLGAFGLLVFECSRHKMHSFSDLKVTNKARYAEHEVHMQLPALEFTGPGLTSISFKMAFNTQFNADPIASLTMLRLFCRQGFVAPLIVGNRPITLGFNLWVVEDVGEDHKYFDGNGTLFIAEVDVKLKEYKLLL